MRRVLATAAAVALVAGCDGSGGDPDPDPSAGTGSGSASESATTDPGPVVTCPDDNLLDPDPALPDEVPAGATSVRLCDGGDGQFTPPADALTTSVTSVAEAVNDQRLVQRGCVDLRIPNYQLAFGYPDGSTFVVAGRFTGCAELLVGSAQRARAKPALNAFIEGIRTQLASTTPPEPTVATDDLDCAQPRPTYVRVFPPTDLATAVLCFGLLSRPAQAHLVAIPPEDLTILVRSMQSDTSSSEGSFGCSVSARKEYWIVGATAWGDPITAHKGCFGLQIEGPEEWTPRGETRAILRQLVSAAR